MTRGHDMTDKYRSQPGPGPQDVDLDRVWTGVAAEVWRRQPGPVERLASRLLRSPGLARALLTTPSLLLGWVLATMVVLLAGWLRQLTRGELPPTFAVGAAITLALLILFVAGFRQREPARAGGRR